MSLSADGGHVGEGDEAGKLGEELGDDVDPEEVQEAIETLNTAIDRVNVLEDEHQAAVTQHSAEQRALSCEAAIVEAEMSTALRMVVQATFETGKALQSARRPLESQQTLIRQLQAQAVQLQAELNMSGLWQERMTLSNMAAELGGQTGLIAPDATTADYVRAAGGEPGEIGQWQADPDAPVAERRGDAHVHEDVALLGRIGRQSHPDLLELLVVPLLAQHGALEAHLSLGGRARRTLPLGTPP